MACPPETSPPKENSTTRPGRPDEAFEGSTSSAGLGRAVLTQVPNAKHRLHTHHPLPLLPWANGDLLCGTLCPQLGRSGWHPTPATYHITSGGSCRFKTHSLVSSLQNLQEVIPPDHLSLDMWVLHASQHSLCLPFKLYSSRLFFREIPQINH